MKNSNKYLFDINEAIEHIEEFTKSTQSFFEYEKNLLLRRAVERELEIIGEAMSKLVKLDSKIMISSSNRIINLRNRVIHGYDMVDNAVIWGILKRHIPKLKSEVKIILNDEEE